MPKSVKIVIADRQASGLPSCTQELSLPFPCNFAHVANEEELFAAFQDMAVQLLVIDSDFAKNGQSFSLIRKIHERHPQTLIVPALPANQPELIKKALTLELYHFIYKPLDPLEASLAIKRVFEQQGISLRKTIDQKTENATSVFHGMIGQSRIMRQLFDLVERIAADDSSTVLIRGESGTGKEMIAKAIHAQSDRRDKNFVPVNCAAIPDDLLESELFGYTKGAFTGAASNKIGRIQYADQGTLFLDEIGDMKGALQAKLLRVIQEKEFEAVGAIRAVPVNTRILAATHCNLEELVKEGKFREDLYYRLSVIPLSIPSLRERPDDLPLLIEAFLEKYADKRGRARCRFSPSAMQALRYYEWRGNVRELENLVQQMSILFAGQTIERQDLPDKFSNVEIPPEETTITADISTESRKQTSTSALSASLDLDFFAQEGQINFNELINDFETRLIIQALRITEGNKKEAARLLNLKRTTLLEKIKKKDIEGLWEK
jgi:DNA-binding NtrC family response regulator